MPSTPPAPHARRQRGLVSKPLVHGLAGTVFKIIHGASEEEFENLEAALIDEHQPQTITESMLVRTLAEAWWLRNRAQADQDFCLRATGVIDPVELPLYMRYQAHHDRVFHRILNDLLKLRATRTKSELQKVAEAQKQQLAELRIESARLRLKMQHTRLQKLESEQTKSLAASPQIGFVPQPAAQPPTILDQFATAA